MEGLFSLGGGVGGGRGSSSHHNPNPEIPPPETLFWYKQQQQQQNDDVSSYPNLELWNQQQQQQHLHNIPLLHQNLYSRLGVGPSMASINVSDDHSSSRYTFMSMSEGGGGGNNCEDCGNQAKKGCPHMRCRTCCKNRGYECQTHLKSTWVPASKRRERQQQQQHQREISKKPRDVNNNNNNNPNASSALACTRLPSGLEQVNFPAVVNSPAEFKCVRVISMDNAVDQYAYQTSVNIGGHVFKGILYDQGLDNNNNYIFGETSSENVVAGVQHLNLVTTVTATTAAVVSSTGALVDPSSLYSAPLNTFMAASGTQFFPHTRS